MIDMAHESDNRCARYEGFRFFFEHDWWWRHDWRFNFMNTCASNAFFAFKNKTVAFAKPCCDIRLHGLVDTRKDIHLHEIMDHFKRLHIHLCREILDHDGRL